MIKNFFDKLFSTRASGLYILLFAISIGVATFVENDFGTSAAQKVIFRSAWFELLLVLFGMSILINIFRFKMIRQKKWAILLFHASILIILIGAGITRYFGTEGRMHIREGARSNVIISNETYLKFKVRTPSGKSYSFDEPVYFASLGKNKFNKSYQIGSQLIQVDLKKFTPNPATSLLDDPTGTPVIKVVISGGDGREEYYLKQGESKLIHEAVFNFGGGIIPTAINFLYQDQHLLIQTPDSITQFQMAIQKTDRLGPNALNPLLVRTLYTLQGLNFVIGDFKPNAVLANTSASPKMKNGSLALLDLDIDVNGSRGIISTYGIHGELGEYQYRKVGECEIGIAYGSKEVKVPFYLQLNDFILDRYPGTNSPSSYASEVTLIDNVNNVNRDQRIYMNHVLDHQGYRFFQSSFDQDELGTVLSVNHDAPGTWVSYLGYFLLTLGMILTLLSRKSRFRSISEKLKSMREEVVKHGKIALSLLIWLALSPSIFANVITPAIHTVDNDHAAMFGRLQVQDQNGRIKPMNSLSSEILRKISRKESLFGQNPDQIILGMMAYPEEWADQPLIKVGESADLKKLLNNSNKMLSYNDFFNPQYILQEAVMKAYNLEPRDRGTFEKELIKLDEKVNICNMVYTGRLMQWFPLPEDANHTWTSPNDPHAVNGINVSQVYNDKYFIPYITSVRNSMNSKNWNESNQLLSEIGKYQSKFGGHVLMNPTKVKLEILLNKMNVFSRLGMYYGLLGLLILVLFFVTIFNPSWSMKWPLLLASSGMGIAFLFHTIGLGLRWYVSGRAPWSNGYESMIYIAFTTVLSSLAFSRKSLGGMAAGAILASTILMVAGLSWMDPEITPLVPVLKSYWLTIHVSMEAGSYGFLTLGALIGILNLVLMIFGTAKNKDRLNRTISELTLTSEMTLIAGLFIISIGTYLGGVWANESWGRYWGWDAKETWALVTILVYAFILHMRFIPGLRGHFAFNIASLFGLASVMMTYFGVNYYLSGLHSYAAGDPVPIPTFVYYTVASLLGISLLAWWKNKTVFKVPS
ncbi:MAG: cytochrome c biogenesis protein CcsA [Saprospiraceae bacterium]|nr:cytochrome c biogenesis protein CcsA [Saprospiraceae bacterium]